MPRTNARSSRTSSRRSWSRAGPSRKCEAIKEAIRAKYGREIETAQVDADNTAELARLIARFSPDLVLNLALPYQDLHIMDACLETGTDYVDTANYEPPDEAHFEYSWQWAYEERFRQKGIMALLGSGFDPGVTNVFTAYAQKHLFDEIDHLDILDCNAASHGHAFATNFNPEINIREVTQPVRHWDNGGWAETPAIIEEEQRPFHLRLPCSRAEGELSPLPRGARIACPPHARHQEGQVLDDLLRQLPQPPQGARGT